MAKTTEFIDAILETKNIDINRGDNKGHTPLHYAIIGENPTINARHLIEKGADSTIADEDGRTPFHAAARYANNIEIVELLLNHKDVNVNYLDNMGRNALYYAKDNEHGIGEAIANRLKEKGAVDTEVEMLKKHLRGKRTGGAVQIKDSSQDSQILTERDEVDLMASKALQDAIINSDVERVRILIET